MTAKPVRGTNGFLFEFKPVSSGVAFIRYQVGDRDGSPINLLPLGYTEALVIKHVACLVGANKAVERAAVSAWRATL